VKAIGLRVAPRIETSEIVERVFLGPLPPANVAKVIPGLIYSCYETDCGHYRMPDFRKLAPVKVGYTKEFDITIAPRPDDFAIVFEGYLRAPTTGEYRFRLRSDDGSQLFIDDKRIVDNNRRGPREARGEAPLTAGLHKIKVTFFDHTSGQALDVYWTAPGFKERRIEPSALFRPKPAP